MFRNKKIMIVAAHPDDELLGLGATMHKLIHTNSVRTHVVILGEGITSRSNKRDVTLWKKELQLLKKNIKQAQQKIGYHSISIFDFPDNRFDSVALLDIVKVVEAEKQKFHPDFIFTHHSGDLNIDHKRTFEAVITATRPLKNESVKGVITFETPSATEWSFLAFPGIFQPNLFIEVSEKDIQAKISAMEQYELESRKYPHPRSPEALKILSQKHGITAGVKYAEAFQIIRLTE